MYKMLPVSLLLISLTACQSFTRSSSSIDAPEFYGTLEPFASEAVYFVMTDRFVDGDPLNNHIEQGGKFPTYQRPLIAGDGRKAYVGYMGGDFKGIIDNVDYIKEMGFTAIWLTPIIDNPDESFSGGEEIDFGGAFKDGGKTGYHGYWGVNFFKEDEHWVSENLGFKEFAQALKSKGMKTVLDVVMNHGSPSFDMPVDQPKFGELYDKNDRLIADHQNLPPEQLDKNNPLHRFYHQEKDIMQLSNLNDENPEVLEYFVAAYSQWLEQGADAFRIDTIKHMPHRMWKQFADRIREKYPDLYMFGESFSFDANFIAQHTMEKNGSINVLDFPGRNAITQTFENQQSDYREIQSYLHLTHGPYVNPYELTTFYDNHDMARMNATTEGFIDAHNWLFTSRGIPVIYYGSEMGFMAGTKEHEGNRNYFGLHNIQAARSHDIYKALKDIANIRKNSIALQKGLQVNLAFTQHTAAFYRVFQYRGQNEIALVLLNKSDQTHRFSITEFMNTGQWTNALTLESVHLTQPVFETQVVPHGVQVWIYNDANNNALLEQELFRLMKYK